ncbi:M20 family metallopeptidase [Sulfolobus acidocaldarius]|uniref:Probable succinyl-diaminopimelate desuccinylase n=4 Tax=Sulfolobus acidocaldarius TaxID=2285 RepID=Q4J8C5_SULAC|nr:M20 family metallopeptidase [Sulfolobus acidocaldarius]AAY80955.1 succinyl-diaminopimelate desuccinylase [Sulfolobus acidocaldarius DSM 639]AGE71556.1 succinyl-diaminopimelate desuccinylase [Sulfolobus acidocaldarius N8]AGE73829.1 succinyl-diaminopimelate desuccinylase [Sulfolobus acidocaldarius Ron12/I]ALU30217.1 succinyl-diaminopimelate desuccinylase [Sulfolobus acidocaldarius]ALU30932.1 succinyl-diaminopimelate desuccinylase [Sulfolobus acidocaldarius]
MDDLLKLVSGLVKIPSVNPPHGEGLRDCANFIREYFSNHGYSAEVVEFDKGWPNIIVNNGKKSDKSIMLNGHYDVVPTGDLKSWSHDPFSALILEDKIYGRGSSDMKSGLAVQMKVFVELADKLDYNLVFTAVPDEESGGFHGAKHLAEKYKPNLVLVSEPSGSEWINIGEKGLLQVKLKSKGKVAHGSLPSLGDNAIMKIVRDLVNLEKIRDVKIPIPSELKEAISARASSEVEKDYVSISFNPGVIKGGVKVNVVPDYAEAEVDMRIPPGIKNSEALSLVKKLVSESEVEPIDLSEPNYTNPENHYVKKLEETISKTLGIRPKNYIITGATDGRYFRNKGIPAIVYGPGELGVAHTYNEFVSFKEVINAYKVIREYLLSI